MKGKAIALAAGCCLLLSGCGGLDLLPYARELEGMALMRTLGVDAAAEGVAVTASTDAGEEGGERAQVAERTAPSISAAVLGMQAEGAAYVYFGHVGQLLLGEPLARRSAGGALDYVLRDVEMRLDTELYVVRDGGAGEAIAQAAEEGSAAGRLEA
ncbi:MAG: spore gernimation protein GerC, partial [Flavonifractor sp.]|nr:spore gernimation protein GerC [Flavonifractor sp.]